MWKPEHRRAAARGGLRYPSDLTDAEWALIERLIPPARRGGRKRTVDVREVLNAIFYVLSTGCQWKALPKDIVPKSTAHYYFMLWEWAARWSASIKHSTSRRARRMAAKPHRVWRSSTARVLRLLKKGLGARSAGLRCGQEGHGSQTPYPRRYARVVTERRSPSGKRPGSRWRTRVAAQGPT